MSSSHSNESDTGSIPHDAGAIAGTVVGGVVGTATGVATGAIVSATIGLPLYALGLGVLTVVALVDIFSDGEKEKASEKS